MSRLEVLKYICSYPDVVPHEEGYAQLHKFTHGYDLEITFDPLQWLASNLREIVKSDHNKIVYRKKNGVKRPFSMCAHGKMIIDLSKVNQCEVCKLFLTIKLNGSPEFDKKLYYCHFHKLEKDISKITEFYIVYGFWYNIEPPVFDALTYVASSQSLISTIGTNIFDAQKHFYQEGVNNLTKVTFCPYVFVASNFSTMEQFIDCRGNIDTARVTKYYIRSEKKLSTNSFDKFSYLANNIGRIDEILTVVDIKCDCSKTRKKTFVDYDETKITDTEVAKNCLLHKCKFAVNNFNSSNFTKEFIDDPKINYDKNMSILNAAEYFVKSYVKHKKVRWHSLKWYRLYKYSIRRFKESGKQMPLLLLTRSML